MPAFAILPLSEFPGLVSVLKRQGEEYRRLKAAGLPLAPSWIIPASSLESVLRQNGKQIQLRQLLTTLRQPSHRADLKYKNQVRRLITHLDVTALCQGLLKIYHQRWQRGQLTLQAFLPSGTSIITQSPPGDANLIQTVLILWAKSCVSHALTAPVISQLAPSIVISHTPTPAWSGELYCRHAKALKHGAILIRIRAHRSGSTVREFQLDSQTLQLLSRSQASHPDLGLWQKITSWIRPAHPRQLNSALRQLAHIGGKLSRLTAYPVKAQFIISKDGIFLTEVTLNHVE